MSALTLFTFMAQLDPDSGIGDGNIRTFLCAREDVNDAIDHVMRDPGMEGWTLIAADAILLDDLESVVESAKSDRHDRYEYPGHIAPLKPVTPSDV